jgi:pSer/pThr/pTyr-binding forkhead associated (FHA) protein
MRDGRTRNLRESRGRVSFEDFDREFAASLVVTESQLAGTRLRLRRARTVFGRGPESEVSLNHSSLSRQHAVVEYAGGGYRVRDLGSTNGTQVNGRRVDACDLEPGDEVTIGAITMRFVLEPRETEPAVYELTIE